MLHLDFLKGYKHSLVKICSFLTHKLKFVWLMFSTPKLIIYKGPFK